MTKTGWIKITQSEVEKIVVQLGQQNTPPEKIGLILRDQHGIPKAKLKGKKVNKILKENNIIMNSEHDNIVKKIDNLKKHIEKNKHDYTSKHSLIKHTAIINKMKKQLEK